MSLAESMKNNSLHTVKDKYCDKHSESYNLTAAYNYNLDENMTDADNSCNYLTETYCLHHTMDTYDLNNKVCMDFASKKDFHWKEREMLKCQNYFVKLFSFDYARHKEPLKKYIISIILYDSLKSVYHDRLRFLQKDDVLDCLKYSVTDY